MVVNVSVTIICMFAGSEAPGPPKRPSLATSPALKDARQGAGLALARMAHMSVMTQSAPDALQPQSRGNRSPSPDDLSVCIGSTCHYNIM